MQTIAETRHYALMAEKLLTPDERQGVINMLASEPELGKIMAGTGGVRKVRYAKEGRGKSGGVRIIYYYHDAHIPLLLITIFAKNEKDNLSQKERNALADMVTQLKRSIRRKYE